MYPSGTGSSLSILIDDCNFNFFSSCVRELSSSNNIDDIGLDALRFSVERPGSPGIRVKGCFNGSNTIPLPPDAPAATGNREISPGVPGSRG